MKKKNIKVCILSNSPRKFKIKAIAKDLSMPYIYKAFKPWTYGFKKAKELLNEDKENIAIIGDQIFTDIFGGNIFGIKTILVKPISKKEFFMTKIKRPLETFIIKLYKKTLKEEV